MKLALVVPCYNEEEVLEDTTKQLCKLFDQLFEKGKIDEDSYILFVNDGSKDQTWSLISKFNEQEKGCRFKFSW